MEFSVVRWGPWKTLIFRKNYFDITAFRKKSWKTLISKEFEFNGNSFIDWTNIFSDINENFFIFRENEVKILNNPPCIFFISWWLRKFSMNVESFSLETSFWWYLNLKRSRSTLEKRNFYEQFLTKINCNWLPLLSITMRWKLYTVECSSLYLDMIYGIDLNQYKIRV